MMAAFPTISSATRRRPRIISFWCRRWWNRSAKRFRAKWMRLRAKKTPRACKSVLTKTLKQRVLAMCLLCDDEKAYQAYMNYLDAMERAGKTADPDKAIDA